VLRYSWQSFKKASDLAVQFAWHIDTFLNSWTHKAARGIPTASPETVNRYNGPRSEPGSDSGRRIPEIAASANRGWQGDIDDARGFASAARKQAGPKERLSLSMMAIGKYFSAIARMKSYNSSQPKPDSTVLNEITQAQSEMADLKTQMGITQATKNLAKTGQKPQE
jgi:hypothetical protein